MFLLLFGDSDEKKGKTTNLFSYLKIGIKYCVLGYKKLSKTHGFECKCFQPMGTSRTTYMHHISQCSLEKQNQ